MPNITLATSRSHTNVALYRDGWKLDEYCETHQSTIESVLENLGVSFDRISLKLRDLVDGEYPLQLGKGTTEEGQLKLFPEFASLKVAA